MKCWSWAASNKRACAAPNHDPNAGAKDLTPALLKEGAI
jgi:hypothetical protein